MSPILTGPKLDGIFADCITVGTKTVALLLVDVTDAALLLVDVTDGVADGGTEVVLVSLDFLLEDLLACCRFGCFTTIWIRIPIKDNNLDSDFIKKLYTQTQRRMGT